ncbi:MAG: hypothetical protein JJ900_15940 [Rhodospirillales bacterium]|nr:hypothetical protein [Rhodospirillales bacterium]MBO6788339.1 hypothetical protein [Rhodospirillales bacterium]
MTFEIIEDGEGLLFRIFGDVTVNKMMDATVRGWQHPAWERIRYQIWDFTGIDSVLIDNVSALAFADMEKTARKSSMPMSIASVVTDEKMKKICERFGQHARSEKIRAKTFASISDARRWIDAA